MATRFDTIALPVFEEQLASHHAKLLDIYGDLKDIRYQAGGLVELDYYGVPVNTECNEVGFSKLCEKLEVPAAWLRSDKCPRDLEKTIIDRKKQDATGQNLFRIRQEPGENVLRSVLTNKYLCFNHMDVWRNAKAIFEKQNITALEPVIWKPQVGDNLDFWVLFTAINADPNRNDPTMYDNGGFGGLKPAIHIRNSEDGTGSVRITGGLYRSYCANGVIFGFKEEARMRQVHMGQHWAMRGYIYQAITLAMSTATEGIEAYIKATNVVVNEELDKIVNRWTSKYALSTETSKLWSKALSNARPVTLADIVMATSDFAGFQTRDIATSMEEMAGAMLVARKL